MTNKTLITFVRRIGSAVFGKDDEFARSQGWEVRPGRFGLSRTYRHPGFRQFASCPACAGAGKLRDRACARCRGTGRITLGQTVSTGRV